MPYRKKKRHALPIVCVLLASAAVVGSYIFYDQHERRADAEFTAMVAAQLGDAGSMLREDDAARAAFLLAAYDRLKAEREAEEARIAAEKAAEEARIEEERRKAEQERIEAERRAEEERIAAEKARAEEEERRKAAEEAAKQAEIIAAEKARIEAEKRERQRLSAQIKAQEANAAAEDAAYWSRGVRPTVDLGIVPIMQKPELPNGCEVSALATVLNSMGTSVSKTTLSDAYLPMFPFYAVGEKKDIRAGGDPNLFFAGNPRDANGYYCFAGPIVACANRYFGSVGMDNTAIDLTGASEDDLVHQLNMGYPVIVWGTLSMGDAFTFAPNAWVIDEATGEKHTPFLNLHCVVLYGYDDEYFLFADPLRGNVAFKRSTFLNAYRQIGSRAVVLY